MFKSVGLTLMQASKKEEEEDDDLITVNKERKYITSDECFLMSQQRTKLKQCKQLDKITDLMRDWKKLWNMRMTVVLIIAGVL